MKQKICGILKLKIKREKFECENIIVQYRFWNRNKWNDWFKKKDFLI